MSCNNKNNNNNNNNKLKVAGCWRSLSTDLTVWVACDFVVLLYLFVWVIFLLTYLLRNIYKVYNYNIGCRTESKASALTRWAVFAKYWIK